jgi:hypothetical protein
MTFACRWLRAALVALTALIGAGAPSAVHAQQQPPALRVVTDSNTVQELHLRDGTKLVGHVVAIDGDRITFRTLGGIDFALTRRDIVKIREIEGFRTEGEFWERDAADSRLFVFPTARVPAHGRGYFGVYELVVPAFGVGVGGIGMLSGGMSLIPSIPIEDQVFYIATKLQLVNVEYAQAAVGAMWIRPGGADDAAGAFASVTAGTELASFTGGLALPLYRTDQFDRPTAFFLGGEVRVARTIKLMSETLILPDDVTLIALGMRILAGPVIVELAGVTATDTQGVLPLVNVTFSW